MTEDEDLICELAKQLGLAKTELGKFKRLVTKFCKECHNEYGGEDCEDHCILNPLGMFPKEASA